MIVAGQAFIFLHDLVILFADKVALGVTEHPPPTYDAAFHYARTSAHLLVACLSGVFTSTTTLP